MIGILKPCTLCVTILRLRVELVFSSIKGFVVELDILKLSSKLGSIIFVKVLRGVL